MRLRFDIPDQLMPEVKKIARVATDDPGAAWSYPLTEAKTRRIARLFRDVRPLRIYDGPSEVHRWSIARAYCGRAERAEQNHKRNAPQRTSREVFQFCLRRVGWRLPAERGDRQGMQI